MVGLGRALTLESAAPDAIAQVRRAWEATPVSSSAPTSDAARPGKTTPASSPAGDATPASSPAGDAPTPVLFASVAFRSPERF